MFGLNTLTYEHTDEQTNQPTNQPTNKYDESQYLPPQAVAATGGRDSGRSSSGSGRGTLPAEGAKWRPEMTCASPGPDSYALLFLSSHDNFNVA